MGVWSGLGYGNACEDVLVRNIEGYISIVTFWFGG